MCGEIYLSVKLFKRVQALLQRTFLLGFKRLPLVCLLRLNDACISVKVVSVMLKVEPNSTEAICRQEICKNQLSKTKKKRKCMNSKLHGSTKSVKSIFSVCGEKFFERKRNALRIDCSGEFHRQKNS